MQASTTSRHDAGRPLHLAALGLLVSVGVLATAPTALAHITIGSSRAAVKNAYPQASCVEGPYGPSSLYCAVTAHLHGRKSYTSFLFATATVTEIELGYGIGLAQELHKPSGPTAMSASVDYQCKDTLAPGYNTIVCLRSKHAVEQYCVNAAVVNPPDPTILGIYQFHARYSRGSHNRYEISFLSPDIHGCDPVGVRRITVFQELRKGPTGQFQRNGSAASIGTNDQRQVDRVVDAPYTCEPDMAGSAIRTVVTLTWTPRKGWGYKQARSTGRTPARAIC